MLEINLLPVREVRKRAEVRQIAVQLGLVLVLTVCAVGAVHLKLREEMGLTNEQRTINVGGHFTL